MINIVTYSSFDTMKLQWQPVSCLFEVAWRRICELTTYRSKDQQRPIHARTASLRKVQAFWFSNFEPKGMDKKT